MGIKELGIFLLLIVVCGGSMMLYVDKHGHIELKTWASYCKKNYEKMYAITPVMSIWKYNNMLYMLARRASRTIRDMSHNILRVDIGRMTLSKCEYIQIKHLMEQWNIDIGELCRYSLMSVVNAHTDLVKARVD